MKIITGILGLMLASSTVFAGGESYKAKCKADLLAQAPALKTQAKKILSSVDELLDSQLDRNGDPTLGMHTSDLSRGAELVLEGIRDLQMDPQAKLSDDLLELCRLKMDIERFASDSDEE